MSWRSENNPLFVSRLRSIKRIPSRCTCRASSSCRLGPPFVNCQETNHFVRLWASALGSVLLAVYVFSLFNVPPPQTGRTEIKRRMMTTAEKREKRTKGWTQESRILSDRHLSIREGPKKQIPSARRPRRVERQPPAGGTDESGNNMPTHY